MAETQHKKKTYLNETFYPLYNRTVISFSYKRYKVDQIGFDSRTDRFGMFVQFDKNVDVTKNELKIDAMTFLTRVGGIIGVGKNFLWIIILCLTYITTFSSKWFKP